MLKFVFYNFPSFVISIIWVLLGKIAGSHPDSSNFGWIPAREYTWSDFTTPITGKLATGQTYTLGSPFSFVCLQLLFTTLYLVLAWYFDNTIASNRGVAKPPYFFLTSKYWCGNKKSY
jgi:hypothetical protein